MIEPLLSDDAFLADVAAAGRDENRFHLWWLGQSGVLLQWRGRHALLDPYLSDSLTKKYAATDKPHTRMARRVIDPSRLDFIDVVSSSHNHTDHLDADTLMPLMKANPEMKLVIPEANRAFVAQRLKIDANLPLGVDDAASVGAGGFEFIGIPAAHNTLDRDPAGRCLYLGYIVKFGPWAIYHSGDTLLYDGMVEKLRRYKIDVAILPINGHDPARRVPGNLDGAEAATLAKEIGAGVAIPCHYEMFQFNTASPELFIKTAERLRQPTRVLRAGERFEGPHR